MINDDDSQYSSHFDRVILICGILFVFAAVLYNEYLLVFWDPTPPLPTVTIKIIKGRFRTVQVYFLLAGVVFISISELVRRISRLETFVQKTLVQNLILSLLSVFLPIFILELILIPFADTWTKTTIFLKDDDLGWKMKPNAEDFWGEIKVKINSKGLRGPELDYIKPPGVFRILYLGDSVTFGYQMKDHELTYPYQVEEILRKKFKNKIETLNTGVGGYSPWQEYIYLSKEGIKYDPDLVVVAFVLNDVCEKFKLKRFGGEGEGNQLDNTYMSVFDRLIEKISSIMYFARKISDRIRLGSDIQKGAISQDLLNIKLLSYYPNLPKVKNAWKMTLKNLGKIFDLCKDRNIPVILVAFPYIFQYRDKKAIFVPQTIVTKYATDNNIPAINLFPMLSKKIKRPNTIPKDYFLDSSHLTPLGHKIVSEIIADFIQNEVMPVYSKNAH